VSFACAYRTYTLADSNDYGYNATATGAGSPGTYTREAGFLAYYEVRQKFTKYFCTKFEKTVKTMRVFFLIVFLIYLI